MNVTVPDGRLFPVMIVALGVVAAADAGPETAKSAPPIRPIAPTAGSIR
jgi:hypothetical protein